MTVLASPSFATEAALNNGYPGNRFNERERQILASIQAYLIGNNLSYSSLDPQITQQTAIITCSQADLIALHDTPKSLIAAPGAGKIVIVDQIEFLHTYSTAAYTTGTDLQVVYHGSTTIMEADEDVVNGGATANYIYEPTFYQNTAADDQALNAMTALANLGVDLTTATNFAAGNAANKLKVRVNYHIVTLLT